MNITMTEKINIILHVDDFIILKTNFHNTKNSVFCWSERQEIYNVDCDERAQIKVKQIILSIELSLAYRSHNKNWNIV